MSVELSHSDPYTPTSSLGPYRLADYLALPDDERCELLYGRIYVSPAPSALHQTITFLFWEALMGAARQTGGIALGAPIDVVLSEHSTVQPDVLYVSSARKHIVKQRIEGAPDVIVEILSDSTARRDRGEKLRLYAESGVEEYWIIDPQARQIDFLSNRQGNFQICYAQDNVYHSEAFPEIVLKVAELWNEVDARLPRLPSD